MPQGIWTDIALDFVEALPRVRGKTVILTVVDRFSKYCHFIPLAHPYSAESVAEAFFTDIIRLHGIPQSMVSDRDPVFTSMFWRELMRLSGTKLQMTTAFHPQSDGQSEAANRVIIMYLRFLIGDRPRQRLRWLPWAEFVFNTAYESSLRDTPFRMVYGRDPPSIRSYEPGETRVAAVAKSLEEREEFLADILPPRTGAGDPEALLRRRPSSSGLSSGRLGPSSTSPCAASSLQQQTKGKLKPRFYGPYQITELINEVAVRLALPPNARLHNVFHVGLLKKFQGLPPVAPPSLPQVHHGTIAPEPERYRLARGVRQVLIMWKGEFAASSTWEDVDTFCAKYPTLQLEDELNLDGGRCHVGTCLYASHADTGCASRTRARRVWSRP